MTQPLNNILVTGGTGFVGGYLHKTLSDKNNVTLSSRKASTNSFETQLNLSNKSRVLDFFKQQDYSSIYHLAAQSSVHKSIEDPLETLDANLTSTLNLVFALETLQPSSHLIFASTSDIYQKTEKIIEEKDPVVPNNPYATSKLCCEHMIRQLSPESPVKKTILRLFNHTGPGQSTRFVLGSFTKQIAEIKLGLKPPQILVGNLSAERDFLDVRDACYAYQLVGEASQTTHGQTYNICSSRSHTIESLLKKIIHISGVTVDVTLDPKRLRPSEVPKFVGSYKKIQQDLGWEPKIPIEQTLEEMLLWWEKELIASNSNN